MRIVQADINHIQGIMDVCTLGYKATYRDIFSKEYMARIIREFYNYESILKEVTTVNKKWGGYFIAVEEGNVIGAGAGGMLDDENTELFVLYLKPDRRGEGIGSKILDTISEQQKNLGALKQYVLVQKGNHKGIPFYEAKGFSCIHEQDSYGNSNNDTYISLRYVRKL
ncbi:GNAT family N-acetyltransferase [Shouchella hunanensis]|uniref:GNAT family N-acetyltransferase n=1 Tax=Shouchella hunanensis TaxID=766894 RepID=A0ABY7WCI3_9BACI|nr:GNAT family N-acetyltransferase [Shouchella hunanensis]WDF05560.1 GNAT family N-acetyltransferase [Shouchella hunanensis]